MIIRGPKPKSRYTCIPNEILNDSRIRFADRGLLCYLLSKPEDWKVSVSHLVKQSSEGRDGIYGILHRLREAGYVEHVRKDGKSDWIVHEPYPAEPEVVPKVHTAEPDEVHTAETDEQVHPSETTLQSKENKQQQSKEVFPPISPHPKPTQRTTTQLPETLDPQAWSDLDRYRSTHATKKTRDTWTAFAKQKAIGLLANLSAQQQRECVDMTIANGWQGIFPQKIGKHNGFDTPKSKQVLLEEQNGAAGDEWLRRREERRAQGA